MPVIKLVATAMDGTLLNSRKEVPPSFFPWVREHPEVRVVIASGRQYYTLLEDFLPLRDRLIFLAENGGLVFFQDQVLYQNTMAWEEVLLCLRVVEGLDRVWPILCGVKSAYMRHAPEMVEEQARMYYKRLSFQEDLSACRDQVIKLALYVEGGEASKRAGCFASLPDSLQAVVSGTEWIDVGKRGVNKGAALRAVQKQFDISPQESMAFGDYMNDWELLQACEESYAMANACPEILAAARHRTASNDEDGVMRVLQKWEEHP